MLNVKYQGYLEPYAVELPTVRFESVLLFRKACLVGEGDGMYSVGWW